MREKNQRRLVFKFVSIILTLVLMIGTFPYVGINADAASKGLANFGKVTSADKSWTVSNAADGGIGTFTSTTGEDSYWVLADFSGYSYRAGDLLSIKYDGVDISEEEIVLTDNSSNIYLDKVASRHVGYITYVLPDNKSIISTRVRIKGIYRNAEKGTSFSFGGFEIHRSGTRPSWDNGSIPEYNPDAAPRGIAVSYYDDIYSRGFAWSTDASVGSSALYIIQMSGNMSTSNINWNNATRVNASMVERTDVDGKAWHVFKAHTTGLTPGATYFYRVGGSSGFSNVGTLYIDGGSSDVTFLHLTDSQESSKSGFDRWGTMLGAAKAKFPNSSFLAFSGDMTNYSYNSLNMNEWIWGLDTASDTLMNMPIEPSSGNHDGYNYSFVDRFDINYADYIPGSDIDVLSGGSYYYTFGSNVLFINLNTNINTYAPEFQSQIDWLCNILESYAGYKWKIVQLHKGPISTGDHTNQYDVVDYRRALCPIFSKYKVDLVLQGHDHVYTRSVSYVWDDNAEESTYGFDYYDRAGNVNPAASFDGETRLMNYEPVGTHYVTINYSASKAYDTIDAVERDANIHPGINPISGNGCDLQPGLPMYGVVRIKGDTLCYDAYTYNEKSNSSVLYDTFAIDKSSGDSGAGATPGGGSSVGGTEGGGNAASGGGTEGSGSAAAGSGNAGNGSAATGSSNTGAGADQRSAGTDTPAHPSNEWIDGKWYNENGVCDYEGTLSWKCNSTGWWVEDTAGWYPVSQWQKIDGKWYYFLDSGYMDYSEYREGCWLGSDGAWVEGYSGGHWCANSVGWWYEDDSNWYPSSQWLWIDGSCYYFKSSGYIATKQYIDGCWVNASGAWEK